VKASTKIIGVVSAHAPAYAHSFAERRFIEHPSSTRVAEGVACKTPNAEALAWIIEHAHEIVTITDDEALSAMREILQATHNLPEGSGALAYAAIKKQQDQWQGKRLACILSGGNGSMAILKRVMEGL
jgi:threonine dehydratase